MEFKDRLKALREEKNMTLEKMAQLLGTSKQVLSRYERGENIPKITTVKRFSDILGVSLSDFVDRDDVKLVENSDKFRSLDDLPEDVAALNVLMEGIGDHIIKTGGEYYLGECGKISYSDIQFIKESAMSGIKMATDILQRRADAELRGGLR